MVYMAYSLVLDTMDPYWFQLDTLAFRQAKETEWTWDLEDSEDAEIMVGDVLSMKTGVQALAKVWQALESWIRSMPVVSFNGGHYDLQLIWSLQLWDPGTTQAVLLSGLRDTRLSEACCSLAQWWGLQGWDGVHPKEGLMLYFPLHPKVVLLGHVLLPASWWVQLCQVAQDLRGGLPAREENLAFLMNMWTIWPSCSVPWHPMWPSTSYCMTRAPWKRASDRLTGQWNYA